MAFQIKISPIQSFIVCKLQQNFNLKHNCIFGFTFIKVNGTFIPVARHIVLSLIKKGLITGTKKGNTITYNLTSIGKKLKLKKCLKP